MNRRNLLRGAIAAAAAPMMLRAVPAQAATVIEALEDELAYGAPCDAEQTALRNTLRRMRNTRSPAPGSRTLVVDLPSQNLAVYDGRDVSFESRVVVGDPQWETPDLETTVSYVRVNPTWTVPESIIRARGWRERLQSDPGYFEDLDFDVEVSGRMMRPMEAARAGGRAARFVQRPGDKNALGRSKIGLNAGNAIYFHDTQDRHAFEESERAISHGCIRVQQVVALTAWTLGLTEWQVEDMINGDDRRDRSPSSPVRVVTTYFTAWPDLDGTVRYYPDIYGRDGTNSQYCSGRVATHRTAGIAGDGPPVELNVIR